MRRLLAAGFARWLAVVALALVVTSAADARQWAWLGVRIRDLSEQEMDEIAARHGIREGFGVVVVEVLDGTPAARAGLKNGDLVVAFENRPVVDTRMLQRLIAAAPMDRDSRLTILRPDGRRLLPIRLTTMPPDVAGDRVAAEFGFVLRDPQVTAELGRERQGAGVPAVAVVLRGGGAEHAGLEVGDVILQVAERPVVTREAAREALSDAPLDRPLQLTVRRGDRRLSLTIPAP